MNKLILGLVAAFAFSTFAAPAMADEPVAPAADAKKDDAKAKAPKGKKGAKKDEKAADAAPPAGDAAKAPPAGDAKGDAKAKK